MADSFLLDFLVGFYGLGAEGMRQSGWENPFCCTAPFFCLGGYCSIECLEVGHMLMGWVGIYLSANCVSFPLQIKLNGMCSMKEETNCTVCARARSLSASASFGAGHWGHCSFCASTPSYGDSSQGFCSMFSLLSGEKRDQSIPSLPFLCVSFRDQLIHVTPQRCIL